MSAPVEPFLRVPPFPRSQALSLVVSDSVRTATSADPEELGRLLVARRVGGTYWGAQPDLPQEPYTLVRLKHRSAMGEALGKQAGTTVVWAGAGHALSSRDQLHVVTGGCDPWHLASGADRLIVDADEDLALIGALLGADVEAIGSGPYDAVRERDGLASILEALLVQPYRNPFTGEPMPATEAARLCGFWRRVIDGNRNLAAAFGFAFWKRPTVEPLLWGGKDLNFAKRADMVRSGQEVAVWRSRCSPALTAELASRSDIRVTEVEDGFIRSAGLGADCVPPLSIVADRSGIYFDPRSQSDLETLIETGPFDEDLLSRAAELRQMIVRSGVSKYASGLAKIRSREADQRYILVPGQVEDDRSVLAGGAVVKTNLDLLKRVRADAPDAHILYKPHPDVLAGHRAGQIEPKTCLSFADELVDDEAISSLIDLVDEVHVNTSLAGFEALLRGKPVTTYGLPFYAGWGLTRDIAPIPSRRTAKRSLDELVAAALLIYPRYLDPVTSLPCPPEVLIQRLSRASAAAPAGAVVQLRRLQGKLKRGLTGLRSW